MRKGEYFAYYCNDTQIWNISSLEKEKHLIFSPSASREIAGSLCLGGEGDLLIQIPVSQVFSDGVKSSLDVVLLFKKEKNTLLLFHSCILA